MATKAQEEEDAIERKRLEEHQAKIEVILPLTAEFCFLLAFSSILFTVENFELKFIRI